MKNELTSFELTTDVETAASQNTKTLNHICLYKAHIANDTSQF